MKANLILLVLAYATLLAVVLRAGFLVFARAQSWRAETGRRAQAAADLATEFRALGREADGAESRGEDRGAWQGWRNFVVARKAMENHNTCSFYLMPEDEKSLPAYKSGQFVAIELHVPTAKRSVVRCYSLSDAPKPNEYRITVRRQVAPRDAEDVPDGVASCFLHDCVEEGQVVQLRAPAGSFAMMQHEGPPMVLIAGGVGITPFISMVRALLYRRSKRPVHLFYSGRMVNDLIHLNTWREALSNMPNFRADFILTRDDEGESLGLEKLASSSRVRVTRGQRLDVDMILGPQGPDERHFYLCGSPRMMEVMIDGLKEKGVPAEQIHSEDFGITRAAMAGANVDEAESDAEYLVSFGESCREATWSSDKGTLLDLAEAEGIGIECSCRAGACGTCAVGVKGSYKYLTEPSFETREGEFLPCVAIPLGDVEMTA